MLDSTLTGGKHAKEMLGVLCVAIRKPKLY